jgi:hypothetical protein
MATKSYKDEIKKLDDEIARINAAREKLKETVKAEALANVETALKELNALGFNYRLVEGGRATAPRATATGTRRAGIRDDVLAAVSNAGPDGIKPADIRAKLGIDGKSGSQSVANALSALKKANKIADKNGAYVAA